MVNIQQKHSNPAILRHDASFVIFFVWKGYHDVFSLFSFFFFLKVSVITMLPILKKYEVNQ